jgi:hypothetical protein
MDRRLRAAGDAFERPLANLPWIGLQGKQPQRVVEPARRAAQVLGGEVDLHGLAA